MADGGWQQSGTQARWHQPLNSVSTKARAKPPGSGDVQDIQLVTDIIRQGCVGRRQGDDIDGRLVDRFYARTAADINALDGAIGINTYRQHQVAVQVFPA